MSTFHDATSDVDRIAAGMLAALDRRAGTGSIATRLPRLDLGTAYAVAARLRAMREARGETVVGRKIGFTNTTIWAEYNVGAPIWGYVYDSTLHPLADLDGGFDVSPFAEPRIEPEIMLGLGRVPEPDMDERALLSCVDWVAHGFEVVQSVFPDWLFNAPDTVAACGLHGALLVGPKSAIRPDAADAWYDALRGFEITLLRDGEEADRGRATNVLGGGPLTALRHLVGMLADDAGAAGLAAGEVISTGTLTRALPISPGQTWRTTLEGLNLPGAAVSFR